MTKGTGRFVLDVLTKSHIVSLEHPHFFLDPDRLADATGMNYAQFVAHNFEQKAIDFLQAALEDSSA